MKIAGDWIDRPGTQAVCAMLQDAGHRALFVGGCVRNALLGEPVADIDIATDARPETVMDRAGAVGLRAVPTGIDHGTVTVIADGLPHEITTFRRDVATDGRRATIAYSTDIAEDARRRDFTMNALYAAADGTVIDPLGGLPDLTARRVRFIEDAEARIREDYLRILRFFRFHAWYGDPKEGPDAEGMAACASLSAGLETLSKERVGSELLKLLAAPDPAPAVGSMEFAGCLTRILPGANARALPVLVHLEKATQTPPDPIRRLAVLGGADHGDLLRLSRQQARTLATIRNGIDSAQGVAELAWRHGETLARDVVLARAAMLEQPLPVGMGEDLARGAAARFPVRAADLPGDITGPDIGATLKRLESRWIASGFTQDKAQLLRGL